MDEVTAPGDGSATPNARDRILLNFPPELGERIRALAAAEKRTITAQVEVLVERALALQQVSV